MENNKYEKEQLKASIQWSLLPILNYYTLGKELSGKLWNKYIYIWIANVIIYNGFNTDVYITNKKFKK